MSLGGFAGKLFEVSSNKIYTFFDDTNDLSLNVEDQEVDGDKPSTYIKGKNLEDVSFNIDLKQSKNIDVETEVKEWREIYELMSPCMLFLGNNPVSENKFLLRQMNVSNKLYSSSGWLIKATLKLTFKEYVRAGVKKEEGTSKSTKKKSTKKKVSSGQTEMTSEESARVEELENQIFGE